MDFNSRMNDIMREWQAEHQAEVVDIDAAAAWAIKTKRYQRIPPTMEQMCKNDMRRALQHSHYTDPQGNKVRTKHPVKLEVQGEQLTFWVDIRTAKPDLMQKSFDQNHSRIANDVKRHSIDKQSYDVNNPYGESLLPYNYDFNQHAEDARMSGKYDDSFDEEDDDDGESID
jgi:hypothetical protein